MGLAFMTTGVAFKIAAVPFHYWTPDAYQGSPTPITGYLSVGPKVGAFALILRLFVEALGPLADWWLPVIIVLAALTMTLGNLVALTQDNVKRMLAYSSIAHTGYMLVGLAAYARAASVARARGPALLRAAYAFMNLGAFAVIAALQKRTGVTSSLDDVRRARAGASRCSAILMTLFLLSLTGIPPTAGFFAKAYVILAAVEAGGPLTILAVIAVLNAAVGGVLLPARRRLHVHARAGRAMPRPLRHGALLWGGLAAATALTILFGLFPTTDPRRWSRNAARRDLDDRRLRRGLATVGPRRLPPGDARDGGQETRGLARRARTRSGPPQDLRRRRPCRPVDGDRQAVVDPARRAAAQDGSKASASLMSSPRTRTAPGRVTRQEAHRTASRLPPASRGRRSTTEPAAVVAPGRGRRDRARPRPRRSPRPRRPARRPRSSAWRTWNATDGPLRSTNSQGGRPSSPATSRGEAASAAADGRRTRARARRRRRWTARRGGATATAARGRRGTRCPPTRTRLATSSDRPAGQDADVYAARAPRRRRARERRRARRAHGVDAAAAGSREPAASVPSKSTTIRSRPGAPTSRATSGAIEPTVRA